VFLWYIVNTTDLRSIFYFSATTHAVGDNSVIVQNSLVIGAVTPNDCNDVRDATSVSAQYAKTAVPGVAPIDLNGEPSGRSGISFPYFSRDNMIPRHPWSSIGAYPCSKFFSFSINIDVTSV
jgi:hypothetical protein